MASKAKSASGLSGLGDLINSPKAAKFLRGFIGFLIIIAAIYGVYTVINQQFSSASNKAYIWEYSSHGIKHGSGKVIKDFTHKNAWYVSSLQTGYVWYGPYVHLPTGKQYMACFFYAFERDNSSGNKKLQNLLNIKGADRFKPSAGSAIIDIVSNANNSKPDEVWRRDTISSSSIPHKAGTYDRACLPFYVPKGHKNEVEFRVNHQLGGPMLIKRVRLSVIPAKNNKLPNLQWLRTIPDNSGILFDKGWKF